VLLVGVGTGGRPSEHAVTRQPSKTPAAAHRPSRAVILGLEGCLRCRTYGSLNADRLYYRHGQRRDPVQGEKTLARMARKNRKRPRNLYA
jgi:hypothetical protein